MGASTSSNPDEASSVDMEKEVLRLKEELESSKVQIESLQASLNSTESRLAILTEYLTRLPSNVSVEVQTESLETRKEEASNTKVESIKVMEKVIQKPAIDAISIQVDPIAAKMIQKLRNRLKDVESRQFVVKAEKELQWYISNNKSTEKVSKARKMYEDYKKNYDSFMDGLKMNIQKIEKDGSTNKLPYIRDDPRKFEINDKIICDVEVVGKNKVATPIEKWTETVQSIALQSSSNSTDSSPQNATLVDAAVSNELKKLKNRLLGVEKGRLIQNADKELQVYLASNKSIEQSNEARKQYEDYKEEYCSFIYALMMNIQKIEKNGTLSDLLTVPKCPQLFEIDENKFTKHPTQKPEVNDKKVKNESITSTKETGKPSDPPASKSEASIPPATRKATIPINSTVWMELQRQKRSLAGTKGHRLVEKAEEKLRKYLDGNKSTEKCEDAQKQFEDHKKQYYSFISTVKANIQKIEQNGTLNNLLTVPRCPQPFEVKEKKFSPVPLQQPAQTSPVNDKKVDNAPTISTKVTGKPSYSHVLKSKASTPPATPKADEKIIPKSQNVLVEKEKKVETKNTVINPVVAHSMPYSHVLKSKASIPPATPTTTIPVNSTVWIELQRQKRKLYGTRMHRLVEKAEEKLQKYLDGNKSMEKCEEARKQHKDHKEHYYSFINIMKTNIQSIEQNGTLNNLLTVPRCPRPFFIREKKSSSVPLQQPAQKSSVNDKKVENAPTINTNVTGKPSYSPVLESKASDPPVTPKTDDKSIPKSQNVLVEKEKEVETKNTVIDPVVVEKSTKDNEMKPSLLVDSTSSVEQNRKKRRKLQKLKSRLKGVENLLQIATETLLDYCLANNYQEESREALKMFDAYEEKYNSFVDVLKTNIQKIEENGSISDLLPVPSKFEPFEIDEKLMVTTESTNIKNTMGNEWSWSEMVEEMNNELDEWNDKMECANVILQSYLNSRNTVESCDEARLLHDEYKKKCGSAISILWSNIEVLKENPTARMSDLHPIPIMQDWFEIKDHPIAPAFSTKPIPRYAEYMIEMRKNEQIEGKRHRRYIERRDDRKQIKEERIKIQRKEKEERLMGYADD